MVFTEIKPLSADLCEGKLRLNCAAPGAGCRVSCGFRPTLLPHPSCDEPRRQAQRAQDSSLLTHKDISILFVLLSPG